MSYGKNISSRAGVKKCSARRKNCQNGTVSCGWGKSLDKKEGTVRRKKNNMVSDTEKNGSAKGGTVRYRG